jgi:hypothetical protein
MSTFGSLAAARRQWANVAEFAAARGEPVLAGDFIARVDIRPEDGHELEDLDEDDEHVILWGSALSLAAAVSEIYPASTEDV